MVCVVLSGSWKIPDNSHWDSWHFHLNKQICTWCRKTANADLPAQAKNAVLLQKIYLSPNVRKKLEKW